MKKKLILSRETVRKLTSNDIGAVRGGQFTIDKIPYPSIDESCHPPQGPGGPIATVRPLCPTFHPN